MRISWHSRVKTTHTTQRQSLTHDAHEVPIPHTQYRNSSTLSCGAHLHVVVQTPADINNMWKAEPRPVAERRPPTINKTTSEHILSFHLRIQMHGKLCPFPLSNAGKGLQKTAKRLLPSHHQQHRRTTRRVSTVNPQNQTVLGDIPAQHCLQARPV